MVQPTHVDGRQSVRILIYALSTCGWCRRTKALLNQLGVAYDYIDVDLLVEPDRSEVAREVEKWNPRRSFPTIVIDEKEVIVGYDEEKLRSVVSK